MLSWWLWWNLLGTCFEEVESRKMMTRTWSLNIVCENVWWVEMSADLFELQFAFFGFVLNPQEFELNVFWTTWNTQTWSHRFSCWWICLNGHAGLWRKNGGNEFLNENLDCQRLNSCLSKTIKSNKNPRCSPRTSNLVINISKSLWNMPTLKSPQRQLSEPRHQDHCLSQNYFLLDFNLVLVFIHCSFSRESGILPLCSASFGPPCPPEAWFPKRETLPPGSSNARSRLKRCKNKRFGRCAQSSGTPTRARKRTSGRRMAWIQIFGVIMLNNQANRRLQLSSIYHSSSSSNNLKLEELQEGQSPKAPVTSAASQDIKENHLPVSQDQINADHQEAQSEEELRQGLVLQDWHHEDLQGYSEGQVKPPITKELIHVLKGWFCENGFKQVVSQDDKYASTPQSTTLKLILLMSKIHQWEIAVLQPSAIHP